LIRSDLHRNDLSRDAVQTPDCLEVDEAFYGKEHGAVDVESGQRENRQEPHDHNICATKVIAKLGSGVGIHGSCHLLVEQWVENFDDGVVRQFLADYDAGAKEEKDRGGRQKLGDEHEDQITRAKCHQQKIKRVIHRRRNRWRKERLGGAAPERL